MVEESKISSSPKERLLGYTRAGGGIRGEGSSGRGSRMLGVWGGLGRMRAARRRRTGGDVESGEHSSGRRVEGLDDDGDDDDDDDVEAGDVGCGESQP